MSLPQPKKGAKTPAHQVDDFVSSGSPYYGLAKIWSKDPITWRSSFGFDPEHIKLLLLGCASALLYVLLIKYETVLVHIEQLAQQGDHTYFLVPIAIALLFSLIHGPFTSLFWHTLGVQPGNTGEK